MRVVDLSGRNSGTQIVGNSYLQSVPIQYWLKCLSPTHPAFAELLQFFIVIFCGEIDDLSDGAFRDVEDSSSAIMSEDKDRGRDAVVACLHLALPPRHASGERPCHPLAGYDSWGPVSRQLIVWMRGSLTGRRHSVIPAEVQVLCAADGAIRRLGTVGTVIANAATG